MKILLGVDDSKTVDGTVRAVATQFRAETTEVMVLHVLEPMGPAPPQMDPFFAPELDVAKKVAEALVSRISDELRQVGFKTETKVELGDIRNGIMDQAAAWGADLIVVGSRGQHGIERLLLGSVAEFVARHAKCSVEIVRNGHSH